MDADDDDFSRLPEDLLLRILRFLPHKAGAVTTALSKRWRPLWTSCGAINLVARILEDDEQHIMEPDAFFASRDKFVAVAVKVLDAFLVPVPFVPVTKLTFRVEGQTANIVRDFLDRERNFRRRPQVLARILAHPAARVVEELRIEGVDNIAGDPMLFETINHEVEWATYGTRMYSINLHSLPLGTLRVLDLTNCGELALGLPAPVFPHLWKLRLRHCELLLGELQSLIDSTSGLASIHLESVLLEDNRVWPILEGDAPPLPTVRSLHCPAATTLVIYKCCLKEEGTLQIIAPKLQHFEYRGVLRHIVMSPPPQELLRVDITITKYPRKQDRDRNAARRSFWALLQGFVHVKQLNLKICLLEGITATSRGIVLPVLGNIERLELCLVFSPDSKRAALLIADLLSCCPTLRNLRVNLTTAHEDTMRGPEYSRLFLERKFREDRRRSEAQSTKTGGDFQDPVHMTKRTRMQPEVAEGEKHFFDGLSELPGLSGCQFQCLHNSLKRVALQFRQGEKSDYGVRLVKFFAENAKVLDEMCVDAGNAKSADHLNLKIEEWVAGWSEKRSFKILPLERQN